MVAREDPELGQPFGIPREAGDAGMKYFLEVFIARDEVLEGWIASLDEKPISCSTYGHRTKRAAREADVRTTQRIVAGRVIEGQIGIA